MEVESVINKINGMHTVLLKKIIQHFFVQVVLVTTSCRYFLSCDWEPVISDIQNVTSDREVPEVIPVIDTFTSLEKETIRHKRNSNAQSKKLERNEQDVKGKNLPKIPNPRQTIRLTFKHTPRIFKTPVRESALKQEEDFIAKNGPLMRTSCHFNVDSLDISENDPFWLKKKGDIFLKGGDYLSAINAYTASFDTSNESIEALAERSLCYLHLGNLSKCICDCEKVLQLMDKKHELESRNICK